MTALTMPARPKHGDGLRPVPWRRMAWVTWRQHRAALGGVAVFLGAFAVYLWLTGLQMHHAEAAYCHPASSLGCTISFTGRYGETAIIVSIALQAVPALIGAFIGAPVLARELETGTFRYAGTQGIGRLRWTVGKLILLAVAAAAAAGAFTVLFAWYNQPWAAARYVTPFSARVFGLLGVAFAAWTLAAFAIGALAGMLIRRVVPAIAATLAAYAGLAFAAGLCCVSTTSHRWSRTAPTCLARVDPQPLVHQGRQAGQPVHDQPGAAGLPPCPRDAGRAEHVRDCPRPDAVPHPARLHELDELPAGQPVLAVPVDRGRLAARARGAAHCHHRLAGPPPRRLNTRQQRLNLRPRPWYASKAQPSTADMLVKLRRVLIAAGFPAPHPGQPTPAIRLAGENAAA